MTPVKFVSQLTKKDFVHIYFYLLFINKKFWLSMLLYLFLIDIVLRFFIKHSFLYSVIFIILWIIIIIVYRVTEFLKAASEKKALEKINWEINQFFIEGLGDTVVIKIPLGKIFKVSETKKFFFIYLDIYDIFVSKAQISDTELKSIRFFLEGKIVK